MRGIAVVAAVLTIGLSAGHATGTPVDEGCAIEENRSATRVHSNRTRASASGAWSASDRECEPSWFAWERTSNAIDLIDWRGEMVMAVPLGATLDAAPRVWKLDRRGNWASLGIFDRPVLTVAEYNGELVAGGSFTRVDGRVANRIARWDTRTSEWRPIGEGFPGRLRSNQWPHVVALTVYNGELMAAGRFRSTGESEAMLARWDGSTWHTFGEVTSGIVRTLAVWKGKLIVGGSMASIDGVAVNGIAAWDGSNWKSLGGANGYVNALAVYPPHPAEGDLIAAGFFSRVGDQPASRVARWDGSTWHAMGLGMGASPVTGCIDPATGKSRWAAHGVWGLSVHEGVLVAGGMFALNADPTVSFLAKWNGREWESAGYHSRNLVYSLASHGGKLAVGKRFLLGIEQPVEFLNLADAARDVLVASAGAASHDMVNADDVLRRERARPASPPAHVARHPGRDRVAAELAPSRHVMRDRELLANRPARSPMPDRGRRSSTDAVPPAATSPPVLAEAVRGRMAAEGEQPRDADEASVPAGGTCEGFCGRVSAGGCWCDVAAVRRMSPLAGRI